VVTWAPQRFEEKYETGRRFSMIEHIIQKDSSSGQKSSKLAAIIPIP
jgi:hypothetical protein